MMANMLVKKSVVPINLRRKDYKKWGSQNAFFADAYIFDNTEECIVYAKELMLNICSSDYQVYLLIQPPYPEERILEHCYTYFGVPLRKTKKNNGAIWIVTGEEFRGIVDEILLLWGMNDRMQIYFAKESNRLGDCNYTISGKFQFRLEDFMCVINECDYIITDSGDGEEFELIRCRTEIGATS